MFTKELIIISIFSSPISISFIENKIAVMLDFFFTRSFSLNAKNFYVCNNINYYKGTEDKSGEKFLDT